MARGKSKAVASRDAGEKKDLEDAKAAFKGAGAETEDELQPLPGETMQSPVEEPKAPSEVEKKLAESVKAPKVEKVADRMDRKYEIKTTAQANAGMVLNPGDTSKLEEAEGWRVQRDQLVPIRGTHVSLRAGQIVTKLTHNLESLRRSGVVLEPVR